MHGFYIDGPTDYFRLLERNLQMSMYTLLLTLTILIIL